MNTRIFLTLTMGLVTFPAIAEDLTIGQQPLAGVYSAEEYSVEITRGHKVAMRDGVKLSVDIYRPKADVAFPALLAITPYSNNPGFEGKGSWFARRGYVVAVADSRGRYDSEGEWDPYSPRHKTDGYDLVEWLAAQPLTTGKVGMFGGSYVGATQWWTASQAPPSLKTIVPEAAPPDQFYNVPFQNGVPVALALDWACTMSGRVAQSNGPGPYGGFGTPERREIDYLSRPFSRLMQERGVLDAPWFANWTSATTAADPYWQGISYQGPDAYRKMTVPSLGITGWFDADFSGTPMNYLGMRKHGATAEARSARMIIGPWAHAVNQVKPFGSVDYGDAASIDWDGYVCRWFDFWLKGHANGIDRDQPVHIFVMGENRWIAAEDWPLPSTVWQKFYLTSNGHANSQNGDGMLSSLPPTTQADSDHYQYDPANPSRSPYHGAHLEEGPVDTRPVCNAADVLVYTTLPLTEAVCVAGPISAKLFLSTSARDTDWIVRLIDVHPDGYAAMLAEGVMRARNRDATEGTFNPDKLSELTPGQLYEYTIDFWRPTANTFQPGHSIRVEICSSSFPYYLPNPNTGTDNLFNETATVVADQTLIHTAQHPSHLLLPIIPRQ